jgi:hypothetical protein
MCRAHRAKQLKYGDPTISKAYPSTQLNLPFCIVDGCSTKPASRQQQYCSTHLARVRKYETPDGLSRIDRLRRAFQEETITQANGCVVFRDRYKDSRGYTFITDLEGKPNYAHRIAHQLFNLNGQPIPEGEYVLHSCPGGDNPSCVCPSHLRSGTAQDNANDMKARGRSKINRSGKKPRLKPDVVMTIKNAFPLVKRPYAPPACCWRVLWSPIFFYSGTILLSVLWRRRTLTQHSRT